MRERKAVCQEREMKQLTTEELDRMLQSELRREDPDENIVLPILKVLRQREDDQHSEITEEVAVAWNAYQAKISQSDRSIKGRQNSRISKAAAIAAVIAVLLLAFPFAVDADGTMDVLYRFTDSIIELFSPGRKNVDTVGHYIFETDNPGLQQVYDAVVEMGITEPVVPMWLPEGYVLEELERNQMSEIDKLYARFVLEDNLFVFQVKSMGSSTDTQYEQENGAKGYDIFGIRHLVMDNRGQMSVAWVNGNVECMVTTTEDEQLLYDIIDSIYRRG